MSAMTKELTASVPSTMKIIVVASTGWKHLHCWPLRRSVVAVQRQLDPSIAQGDTTRWLWALVSGFSFPTFNKAGRAMPIILQQRGRLLSCYSSEIPRVHSTSDEMSITQMRRTLVYGPPGLES